MTDTFLILWAWKDDGDPLTDVEVALADHYARSGARPCEISIALPAFRALATHPLIIDRLKHTEPGTVLTSAILADIFDVECVQIIS